MVEPEPGFFDAYPRFFETSTVGSSVARLNARHRALVGANLDCIARRSILDLASHDGRWSFAALQAGAAHVMGIEARAPLVERAEATFREYHVMPDRFSFRVGDIFDLLADIAPGSIETVFCFGLLYHTLHHQWLLNRLASLDVKTLLIDTFLSPSTDSIIEVYPEAIEQDFAAWPARGDPRATALIGIPSQRALELMLENIGCETTYVDWHAIHQSTDWTDIEDYRDRRRVTLRAEIGVRRACGAQACLE